MTTTTKELTFSAVEVAEMLGVSYRMIDYWLRNGFISIENPAAGSGSRRTFTMAEVEKLRRCIERTERAQRVLSAWSSGALWAAED